MKPKAPAKEKDSESRVREPEQSEDRLPQAARRVSAANQNRLHGLMRGGIQPVIGVRTFQSVESRLLYWAFGCIVCE
jgi:hypothetical protein